MRNHVHLALLPDEVLGLPLHPLVVHGVVVLVPLAALGTWVMASSGRRSVRYSPAVVFVAFIAVLSAFVARWSGQQLQQELGFSGAQHFELGNYVPWVALLLFVVIVILTFMDRQNDASRNLVGKIFALVCSLIALGAVVLVVITGHSGAELVWS